MSYRFQDRHQAREWVAQLLFQHELNRPSDIPTMLEEFWSERPSAEADQQAFTRTRVYGVIKHQGTLDEKLQGYAQNWTIDRMGVVDRCVLRLALYELFYCPDVPPVVVLDEAIVLARELSDEASAKFINGILDRALRDIDRPLRTPSKKQKEAP